MQRMMDSHTEILVDFTLLKVGKKLGKGSTATVYKGLFKRQEVAIKVFLPPEITEEDVNSFSHEAKLAASLVHDNIIKTIGICVRPPSIALVCEFCEHGNLGDFIRRPEIVKHSNSLWCLNCAIDAMTAVEYLHSHNILHRDIKADNFFLHASGAVKLGDFGESTLFNTRSGLLRGKTRDYNKIAQARTQKMSIVGTVSNMAPEMINAQREYTEAVDIYSLGVTLWEIWTAKQPFQGYNQVSRRAWANENPGISYRIAADFWPSYCVFPSDPCQPFALPFSRPPQFHIYKLVGENNVRPDLPNDMNSVYKECVNGAWGQNAKLRPSASSLRRMLCSERNKIVATTMQNTKGGRLKSAANSTRNVEEESSADNNGNDAVM